MPLASSPEYVKQINSVNYVDGTLSARKSFGAKAVFFVAFHRQAAWSVQQVDNVNTRDLESF
jgi:hypothetical protein